MCLDESKCIAFFVKNSCRDFYYPLPMKFGKGNVFTGVCLSMGRRVSRSLDRSYGRVHPKTWDLDTLLPAPSGHGTWIPDPTPRHRMLIPYHPCQHGPGKSTPCYWHLVVITRDLFKLVHLWTPPHPVLTPSGSHQKTYSWQAGSGHPTGMLSCFQNACKRASMCLSNTKGLILTIHKCAFHPTVLGCIFLCIRGI